MSENVLLSQLKAVLPKGMHIPREIEMLCEYIEEKGYYRDIDGARYGFLYPEELNADKDFEDEREGGTDICFRAGNPDYYKYWFASPNEPFDDTELRERVCVFAQSGAEGSQCLFCLNDKGEQKIAHMGSGSGSMLFCVLAENAVDFLRLLAIGYDEICWNEEFPYPPNEFPDCETRVKPNFEFREWVEKTFGVTVPRTALEIVRHPAEFTDESSEDEFWNWADKFVQ